MFTSADTSPDIPRVDSAYQLQSVYIGQGGYLKPHLPSASGNLASDEDGVFKLIHTFDSDAGLGGALVLTCWIDAVSVAQARFCASLSRRISPGRTHWHEEDQPLPCITSYVREAVCPCLGDMRQITLRMTTRPTRFFRGDQLVLRLALAPPRGSEVVIHGLLHFGGNAPSVLMFSVDTATPAHSR